MNQSTSQGFKLTSKSFFLTYPQCPEPKEALVAFLKTKGTVTQVVVSRELHESGEPHLHSYVKFSSQKTVREKTFDWLAYHPNIQSCKNYYAVVKYIKKDSDYIEEGMDTKQYEKAHTSKKRYIATQLLEGSQTLVEAVRENPELLFEYKKLKQNLTEYQLDSIPQKDTQRENYWVFGDPGIGKSQWAKRTYPDAFRKATNKWWDGYKGQKTVIMDDLDNNCLGHYLKIWGDNYACDGEVKGGTIPLTYTTFIVTSNYRISQLWKDDPIMAQAIARRFTFGTVQGSFVEGYTFTPINNEYINY